MADGKASLSIWIRLLVAIAATTTLLLFVFLRPLYDVDAHAWHLSSLQGRQSMENGTGNGQMPNFIPEEQSRMLVSGGLEPLAPEWMSRLPQNMGHTYYPVLGPDYVNKGHEAMFYLRYIVDHYDDLPNFMIFVHDHQRAWHNSDTADRSVLHLLSDLRWEYVETQGFVNLRCQTKPNCPSILPLQTFMRHGKMETFFQQSWMELFEEDFGPAQEIAATCCAQFAVTREAVHLRAREFYERIIRWIEASPGTDWQLGRVLEYTWHIIFGRDFLHCPDTDTCRFNLYGYKRDLF